MCGISGFIDFNSKLGEEQLKQMTDVLHHRGPDSSGYRYWKNDAFHIGFGHRRLSIIDLSEGGKQPKTKNGWHITFNGEIYNYQEIKKQLADLGHSFSSGSDTEVILAAFEQWGTAAVDRFIGMFAFALYHEAKQKVYIFRDRAGVKPLFLYQRNGLILFASELKSFHKIPDFKKVINREALHFYLQYGYVATPHCIFENCSKLIQGHYLEIDLTTQEQRMVKYWDVNDYYRQPNLDLSEAEVLQETEKLMTSAFNYRMVADVPVGVFLSGGFDSSVVTAVLQKNSAARLNTFTIGFQEEKFNEAIYAKQVAEHLGTNHTEYYCTYKEAMDIIPTLAEIYDEPFGDPSAIPTILVSQMAKKNVKVALSADGGDELFAGYKRYQNLMRMNQLLSGTSGSALTPLLKLASLFNPNKFFSLPSSIRLKNLEKMANIAQNKHSGAYIKQYAQALTNNDLSHLLLKPAAGLHSFYEENGASLAEVDFLNATLAKEYKIYMADDILVKVDRASMSVGLEAREPFLDQRLIEFLARVPSGLKYKQGNLKHLLKKITYQYLPEDLMNRPKMGFGVPVMDWLKNDLSDLVFTYLNKERLQAEGIFNYRTVLKGRDEFLNSKGKYHKWLWNIILFEMWYERWMKE